MLRCSIWFSTPSLWMGDGLESRCVDGVCGWQHPHTRGRCTVKQPTVTRILKKKEGGNWIPLAQDPDKCRSFVIKVAK